LSFPSPHEKIMNMEKAAILIVEDDEDLRLTLADNLRDEGYDVACAANGSQAHEAMAANKFALVILDIMLPDTDGYSICRAMRESGNRAMILMLTARSLEEDLVRGFEAGADDYLCKPYRLRELLARTRALLRRNDPAPRATAHLFAGYRIDEVSRSLTGPEDQYVDLTKTEFDLLLCLYRFRGQALTRDRILDEVWGADVVVDGRTVDNFVSSLKRKMGWSPGSGFSITSIRGVGYRFEILEE